MLTHTGFEGDYQADLKHHGGAEKAVHHYARDHFETWAREYPVLIESLRFPGAFGENFSTWGMTEADVCVGDVYRIGEALIQVSQGRQPCWKLGVRFGFKRMPLLVQNTGRTGWYYRVLETGLVQAGQELQLVERPHDGWTIARLARVLYHQTLDYAELTEMAALEHLAQGWRLTAQKRIATRTVEKWEDRLNKTTGPS
jgi:MOSC domain-containing protein YiiM